ncbi:hypothetical protein J5N97_009580 [Dioscorea zingiberensis]|uniref:Choline transporter-like protein n=1 Tax=Dioscorea zingiberensis TaxID=325984 RepID=A0A9D5CZR2_9LILI|nr:hypothetical protein J5N97_009580 [Dioscorea zingiberensis]
MSDSTSTASVGEEEDGGRGRSDTSSVEPERAAELGRRWRDVFWLCVFLLHLLAFGFALGLLRMNRFQEPDRLNIDRYRNITGWGGGNGTAWLGDRIVTGVRVDLTETFWPLYGLAGGVGTALAWAWLVLLGSRAGQMMKLSVHILTTYLAVVSVLCFWGEHFFWGVAFAVGAGLQFLYVMSVMDRFPFTMLVLQKAVNMVWDLPEVMRVAYAFVFVMLCWLIIWTFGVAGTISLSADDGARWWLLVVFSVSLFWTVAVLCNTVHAIVSGMVFLVLLIHGGRGASFQYAVTTSFGSICYGSLFTAAIRTLRWEDSIVQPEMRGSCSNPLELKPLLHMIVGAVLLMGIILGGLITGTCTAIWTHFKRDDRVIMVGSTAMLMGMILVGLAVVVIEGAVTSIYICYAEDPSLIQRWDVEFYNQMAEALHQRLQYRSARAGRVTRLDQIPDTPSPI